MKQIEADVVLVARVDDEVFVQPLWECTLMADELYEIVGSFGLMCVESVGNSYAHVIVYDYRTAERMAELQERGA